MLKSILSIYNIRGNTQLKKQIPIVTIIILGLNILGLIYEFNAGERIATYTYGMYQGALENGQYLRAIVSAFLHYGITHFACNMICLISYGFDLERKIGPLKYAVIYIAGIIGSALLINFAGGNAIHAGASGAIWGLMTATLIYNIRHGLNPTYAFRGIILNLVYSFSANVSWQGHIGGGIAGLIAAFALCGQTQKKDYYINDSEQP